MTKKCISIYVLANAKFTMRFYNVNEQKKEKYCINKKGVHVFFLYNLSGKLSIEIVKEGIEVYIFGLFIGKNHDNFHLETVQHHKAPLSTSNLLIKGIFFDKSRFVYQGLIRIEKTAQKSHAYQKNQNILMSDTCFVDSRPFLEILANEVFCTHGSTTGPLNQDRLYYLQTRGLDLSTAKRVLLEGFVQDLFGKLNERVGKKISIDLFKKICINESVQLI